MVSKTGVNSRNQVSHYQSKKAFATTTYVPLLTLLLIQQFVHKSPILQDNSQVSNTCKLRVIKYGPGMYDR